MRAPPPALALVALPAVGLLCAVTAMARADATPTSLELLRQCDNGSDYCVFHPGGATHTFWSTTDLVGQTANCTDSPQQARIAWSKTTTSSNSVGVSLKVVAGATKAFLNGFKIAYRHEWTTSRTDTDTTIVFLPPGYLGRVYHAQEMETVEGQYELHFGDRFFGHYYWYVPFRMTSPRGDGNDSVTTKSTPLTAAEKASYCG